ncbi:hypothetical protein GCM10010329_19710 [Streptomyces spiroverticillatus]|uniref:DUF2961 domain-containing protein n=1 Tax=Streptomyces finlayi TaxID=67296 RepID=A0A918WU85_9ACTN|nr:glycoside hydrolase family 172 protein [Streptomyces finlayi]GGZ98319.1 hypothetical protein GCM10010329_19710 [Streptomyces spiroverticillatus]GHC83242.1 hypothetical protein GCM10010334_12150 [Streptomyces finlayi]
MWFTRWQGDLTGTGRLVVELDGKRVVDAPLADVVSGRLGAPFVAPLVADPKQSSGGALISVPMPYRKSMRVTTEHNPHLYQVGYRSFADAEGVRTFDPGEKAEDVVELLRKAGTQDPKPALAGSVEHRARFDLAPGKTRRLAHSTVPGLVGAVRVRLPQTVLRVPPPVEDTGRAYRRGGGSTFTVAVDPGNRGVLLTRPLDRGIGGQEARVYVDGESAGEWKGLPGEGGRWDEQGVELPAALTAGRSRLTIRTECAESSTSDCNEFTYWVRNAVGGPVTDTVDVGGPSSEQAHGYRISGETWRGTRTFRPLRDARQADESRALLRGLRLRAVFDGVRTVDAPLGEFTGSGFVMAPVRSLMQQLDPQTGEFVAWWPMPYARSATVELYNGSGRAVSGGTSSVTTTPSEGHARAVRTGTEGYFRATSRASSTVADRSWEFLSAQGGGKLVGVSHSMQGAADRYHMEGDERVFADGSSTPQVHGTGTEDLYRGAWYFLYGTYLQPLNGHPARLTDSPECGGWHQDCSSGYRLLLADAVPFGRSLRFTVEHGPYDDLPADYAATTYWYGQDGPRLRRTDSVAADDVSQRAPMSEIGTLAACFEGEYRKPQTLTAGTRTARVPVVLDVAVDPANRGVVLRRTGDQEKAGQRVRVQVDGHSLPDWYQPLSNPDRRWLEDSYQLPASVTRGKDRLRVTLSPVKGAPGWSAASYEVDSVLR